MSVYVVNNYYADETNISWDGGDPHSNTLQYDGTLEFTGTTEVISEGGNKRNVTFDAPEIIMKSQIWIYNDDNNSITYRDALVNFDEATWNATFVGRMFFTGTSSLNITANSIGKTLIKASTLAGTITLDVEDGVQDGDTFLVQATDNQLVITDGEWTATPSTVGNVTTYTLAKVAPVYKTRLIYEHLTDIPLNFTEVEFIQSTGTQYIDTGYSFNSNTDEIELYYQNTSTLANKWLFGSYENNANIGISSANLSQVTFWYKGNVWDAVSSQYDKNHILRYDSTGMSNDGVNLKAFTSYTGTWNLYLFALNNTGTSPNGYFGYGKIWAYKHKRNGVLVRDFVPCLDNNNVPCMYDKVEGKAYYNAGTGSFTYGRKIIPVEYLEGTGTQWINTGIFPANEMEFESKFTFTSLVSTNLTVIGSRDSTKRCQPIGAYNNKWSASIGGSYDANGSSVSANTSYVVKSIISNGQTITLTVNGNQASVCTSTTGLPNQELYIFGRNFYGNTDPVDSRINAKMYFMKIKAGNVLVRDFVPCKDENNVGYMFDRVTHTAYLNAGTGSFTYGKVMPKKKLRLIMDSKRRVPKGFKEVEYLESTGTQYIDTGVLPTQLTEVEYRCAVTGSVSNNDSHLFGSRLSASSEAFDLAYMNTPANGLEKFRFIHGTTTTQETTTSVTAIQIANPHTYYMSGTSFKVDGSEKMSFTTTAFTGTYSLWLFGVNSAGSLHNQVRAQCVYKCTIWDNGTLVRDFIPCLDSNNVPCMWDAVERKAYYNAGTGSFTYGHTITPVEYLQSSGTQYIDTGYIASNTSGFSVKIMPLQSTDKYFIGSRPRTATNDRWLAGSNVGSQVYIGWNTNNFVNWELNKVHTVQNNFINSRTKVLDGTVVAQISETLSSQGSRTAYLFSANDASAVALDTCRIYGTQISDGSSLVRDYIPVKDENNVGYMLDKVSHTLYSNAGTGDFVVGGEYKDIVRFLKGE